MNLQVGVLDIQRQREPFALDGAGECGGDVEVERVAEFVRLCRSAGLDAGGEVAGVVASEAGFSQGAEQVAQRLEAEKVQAFVSDFELGLLLVLADLASDAGLV